jgi:hypothetical protein
MPRSLLRGSSFTDCGGVFIMENCMKKELGRALQIKSKPLLGLLVALTGCVGYVASGYYDGAVVVPEPDQYLFGGEYYHGRDAHDYSHRGSESRAAAHSRENHGDRRSDGDRGGKR